MKIHFIKPIAFAAILLTTTALFSACEDDPAIPDETLTTDPGTDAKPETLRLISYNILEGMKEDKEANFDNFVAWVKEKNPDMMALEECNYFTEESLAALSTRWGHPYAVICKETGYPVALTSKYPIELRNRLLDNVPLWHGAIHTRIKDINVVVLHLYPFGDDRYDIPSGDKYRTNEIKCILDSTIRRYPIEPLWVMCGDFNSYSSKDKDVMGDDEYYETHTTVLQSGYFDVLRDRHNQFFPTIPTEKHRSSGSVDRRLDYIYVSQPVMREMIYSGVIYDDFTDKYSDHYPVMIEFRHYPSGKQLSGVASKK